MPASPPPRLPPRPPPGAPTGGSKYDFVKVRVWLAGDHYYVLSRYLVARMLTAATVPPKPARRAAAALKKALVDADRLDVTSGEMEAALFGVLEAAGLGAGVRATYGRVSRFLSARTGLAVVVAGAPWGGASGLAAKLAERLNLAAPAHTDLLAVALRGPGGALPPAPPWARGGGEGGGEAALAAALDREGRAVRAALQGELDKCARDGRSTVLEGALLDPVLYVGAFAAEEAAAAAAPSPRRPPTVVAAVVHTPAPLLDVLVREAAAADPALAAGEGGVDGLVARATAVGDRLRARAAAVGVAVVSVGGLDGDAVEAAVGELHEVVLRVMGGEGG